MKTETRDVVRTKPFAPWPLHEPDEVAAVTRVLESGKVNYWTGEEGSKFESEYAQYLGRNHAIALANGTVALELALEALEIGPGDKVVTTSRTFIASASAIVLRGATPVIADVDRNSQNLTAETVERVLTPRTKAVIAVHLAGWPCDMEPLLDLADSRSLAVIEDCAQAHGATYRGTPVGAFGAFGSFSFCQDKILTTGGEGGLLAMDDEAMFKRAWAFKDHGKSYDAVFNRDHPPGFRWLHESFGTNWRLTEMQSAIGRVQLRKLPVWSTRRRQHAQRLNEAFEGEPGLRVTVPPADIEHAYYKYYVFVRPEALRTDWDRDRIMTEVTELGIPCFSGSCSEIYLEKAFEMAGLGPSDRLPVARELGETSMMFLVHPTLKDAAIEDTIRAVQAVMQRATR
jgi:dTDP-4-amino-4,6-dideoxygalactose transaminase